MWALVLIFIAAVRCGFPVYCLSFIAGERLVMGSVEQEKKKNNIMVCVGVCGLVTGVLVCVGL